MDERKSQAAGQATAKPFTGATLTLAVSRGIKLEALHKALDEIVRVSGCPACGLNGFDISFRGERVNPAIDQLRAVEKFEGIQYADIRQNLT